jgi:hypothetical protein
MAEIAKKLSQMSILELFSRAGLAGKEEDDEIRLVGGEMVAFVKSFLPPPVTPV